MHRLSYERRCLNADHVRPVAEHADVAEHDEHDTEQKQRVHQIVADPGVLELAAAGRAPFALLDLAGDSPHIGGGLAVAAARRLVVADSSDRAGQARQAGQAALVWAAEVARRAAGAGIG